MLEPSQRNLLLECLQPPDGFELSHAVGTSYTLDLLALLSAPLAFTLFSIEDRDGRPTAHPLALLEAVRRYAEKISLFCQAGEIQVPPHDQLLYGRLEGSVVEVTPSGDRGVFHPKVWVLRFESRDSDTAVEYRVLCLSRNLTFDRSWDVILTLDGTLTDRRNAFARNHPLGDFLAGLPDLAIRPVTERTRQAVELMQDEIRRVDFVLPGGFDDVEFWPLGVSDRGWPFEGRIDRMLVISPFVSPSGLERLRGNRSGDILVSRADSLNEVGQSGVDGFEQTLVLSEAANPVSDAARDDGADAESDGTGLRGLHAKVYVADAGWDASVWVGSANATSAAYEHNVEFLVELSGKKSQCGIEATLGEIGGGSGLGSLLEEYEPPPDPQIDEVTRELEREAEELRHRLARELVGARVRAIAESEEYEIDLLIKEKAAERIDLPDSATLIAWPISQREAPAARPVDLANKPAATFAGLSIEAITSFVAFKLTLNVAGRVYESRFVLNAPLEGAPEERDDAVLRALLRNKSQVMAYLLLLLSRGGGLDVASMVDVFAIDPAIKGDGAGTAAGSWAAPLLESMVRTLDEDPASLDQVAALIEDLRRSPEGLDLLPDGLDRVWDAIWSMRKELE